MAEDVNPNPNPTATGADDNGTSNQTDAGTQPKSADGVTQQPETGVPTEEQTKALNGFGGEDHAKELLGEILGGEIKDFNEVGGVSAAIAVLNKRRVNGGFNEAEDKGAKTTEPLQSEQKPAAKSSDNTNDVPKGWDSIENLQMQRIFKDVVAGYDRIPQTDEELATITDGMTKLGIPISDGKGHFNTTGVSAYLDLYNSTKPAAKPKVTPSSASNAPIADDAKTYETVDDLEHNFEAAKKIVEANETANPQFDLARKVYMTQILKTA